MKKKNRPSLAMLESMGKQMQATQDAERKADNAQIETWVMAAGFVAMCIIVIYAAFK